MLYCYSACRFRAYPNEGCGSCVPVFPTRPDNSSARYSLFLSSNRIITRYEVQKFVPRFFLYHTSEFFSVSYWCIKKNGLFFFLLRRLQIFDYLASRPVSSGPAVEAKMRPLSWAFALAALAQGAQALELLKNEAMILYSDVSPKLRVITKSSAFKGGVKAEPCPCVSRSLCIYIYARGARAYFKHYRR